MNLISKTAVGTRKIYFLDALHFNNIALGFLRPSEDSVAIDAIPKDSEADVDKLKEIVSSFSDIDEALGMADSVQDFNLSAASTDRLDRSVLVLVGYLFAFSGEAKDYIKRIFLNYEHFGISPILIDTQFVEKKDDNQKDIPVDGVSTHGREIERKSAAKLQRHHADGAEGYVAEEDAVISIAE